MLKVSVIREMLGIKNDNGNWYAIYKGDKFLFQGTKKECAEYLGVKEDTVYFYTTPTYLSRFRDEYADRIIVIKVEEVD